MNQTELQQMRRAAERGEGVDETVALSVLCSGPSELAEILAAASLLRKRYFGNRVTLCSVMNIKSGACGEDCAFCAQSARHKTRADVHRLRSAEEMVSAYDDARRYPIKHFGLVASGMALDDEEIEQVCRALRRRSGVAWCASLGCLDVDQIRTLKQAGIRRYHHNLETAESYFPNVCSTHAFADRKRTLQAAREAGLELCAGGILGMGESLEQRVELAAALAEENVASIPLNFLIPVPGTRLENLCPMAPLDMIRCIAMFRAMNPSAEIRVCAGRVHLRDLQSMVFLAGATGIMIGPLLTVAGGDVDQDLRMLRDLEVEYDK